ncbi:ATP-binding cassette domain-containing protein [Demequina sp. TTPB684]|uniref:multiple monosaccharide ABC transporter ATP-binding protein n=1 Tax=unclassified Demequina TaxID=2620311 RepID=UPI001CF1A711|nr:multiple monosaccharide ABC transporter ATP-binding protein [Demequina sp. TMPB413]MCB2413281.1 ATP-binding cassette domain-containing protein [Demequina sp. TTPB684]UPU88741.1 ATP-binding cassette domain-containing protein [Demequina sp. TMPB413]
MSDLILKMKDIVKEFSGVRALDGVSLDVQRGEVHGICGENGAGKSTLMKVLSGVYPHGTYEGHIEFDGKPVEFRSINDSEHSGIVIIHQELALSPYLSIAENIFLGNERASRGIVDWHETNAQATQLLERVGLKEEVTTQVLHLGVGKQQLVEIAKALSKDVKLLILDEPTAALNDDDSAHLLDLIRGLRDEGITCIIISHKLAEIRAIADTITVIRDGETVDNFSMSDKDNSESRLIKSMVGRPLDNLFPPRTPNIGEEVFRVENWNAYHPVDTSRKVVKDASFYVRAGEVVGFAGLMGAGRTELAMSLFGRQYGTKVSGKVLRRGKEISTRSVNDAIANGVAYVTEDRKRFGLNLIATIAANITGANMAGVSNYGVIDLHDEIAVAEKYRDSLSIKTDTVTKAVGTLSGGNQQKVVLSKWLNTTPEVLILDEPTRGVDVGAKYEIYGIINKLASEGKAIVVISSELPELLGLSDRIYTISEGRITGDVPREEATQERLMQLMTAGEK